MGRARNGFRRVVSVAGVESRIDGERVDSSGGDLDQPLSLARKVGLRDATILENNIVQTAGSAGESIAFRRRRDDAGDHDSRFRPRVHARNAGGNARRSARNPDDDSAAARFDRAAAWNLEVSGGHGLRGGVEGRCASEESRAAADPSDERKAASRTKPRRARKTIFTGFGIGFVYQVADGAFKGWKDTPAKGLRRAVQGRFDRGRDLAGAAGRRLHHRSAHRLDHVRGRRARLSGSDPGDQVLR